MNIFQIVLIIVCLFIFGGNIYLYIKEPQNRGGFIKLFLLVGALSLAVVYIYPLISPWVFWILYILAIFFLFPLNLFSD